LSIDQAGKALTAALRRYFGRELDAGTVRVVAEPGQFFSLTSCCLLTKIVGIKKLNGSAKDGAGGRGLASRVNVKDCDLVESLQVGSQKTIMVTSYTTSEVATGNNMADSEERQRHLADKFADGSAIARYFYYIDVGLYGSFLFYAPYNLSPSDHRVPFTRYIRQNDNVRNKSSGNAAAAADDAVPRCPDDGQQADMEYLPGTIWGPTCDSTDRIVERCLIPRLQLGDWILFGDMGAYSAVVASAFCGFPIPEVVYVISGSSARQYFGY
jgi:hypothetical protein